MKITELLITQFVEIIRFFIIKIKFVFIKEINLKSQRLLQFITVKVIFPLKFSLTLKQINEFCYTNYNIFP